MLLYYFTNVRFFSLRNRLESDFIKFLIIEARGIFILNFRVKKDVWFNLKHDGLEKLKILTYSKTRGAYKKLYTFLKYTYVKNSCIRSTFTSSTKMEDNSLVYIGRFEH